METAKKLAAVANQLVETAGHADQFLADAIAVLGEVSKTERGKVDPRTLAMKLGVVGVHSLNVLALGVAELLLGEAEAEDDGDEDGARDEGDDVDPELVPLEAARRLRDAPFALRLALVRAMVADIRDDMEVHVTGIANQENAAAARQNAELLDEVSDSLCDCFGVYAEGFGGGQ